MKICPRCQTTYADDNLNFCLEDGSTLSPAGMSGEATLVMQPPRSTAPAPEIPTQQAWASQQQPMYPVQPQKKSRAWIWVLLILGAVMLLCGGGVAGLVYLGSQVDTNTNRTYSTPSSTPTSNRRSTDPASTSDRNDSEKLNLANWVSNQPFGSTEYLDGEFVMASKQKRYYYVLCGRDDNKTANTDTKVTLRNIDGGSTLLGYGLVFHSNPTPLQQGYAFLIDSNTRKYRVVKHSPQKEDAVIAWTKSDAIVSGSGENTLEMRDKPDKIELFINGKLVNSIKNTHGYPDGVVGLYVSDALKIGFKDLEISK